MEGQTFHCISHGFLPASDEVVEDASFLWFCVLLEAEVNFLSSLYGRTLRKPSANIYSALFSFVFWPTWTLLGCFRSNCECKSNAGLFHFCSWAAVSPPPTAHFLSLYWKSQLKEKRRANVDASFAPYVNLLALMHFGVYQTDAAFEVRNNKRILPAVALVVHPVRLSFSKSLNSWAEHFKKAELTIVGSPVMQWLAAVRRLLNYKSK